MIELKWLQTFTTLAETRHFGRAAEKLHMTQPNVSLQIRLLEQEVRAKLLERNPFCLTAAGERLLHTAQHIQQEMLICQADLNAMNDLSQGTLTIAVSDIISRLLLIRPLQQFKEKYPGIDLSLLNTTSSQAAELVQSAKADLGFVMAQKDTLPLYFTPLHQIRWYALGDNLSAWQHQGGNEAPTLILLGHDTRTRELLDSAIPSLQLDAYRVMEVGSVDAQIDWAEAGFGIAIVPDFALATKRQLKTNVTLLTQFPSNSLGYVVRKNQVLSKAMKQLLKWIEDTLKDQQVNLPDTGN